MNGRMVVEGINKPPSLASVLHDCWILLSHMVPAYAADLGYLLIGRKPRMVKVAGWMDRWLNGCMDG